MEQSPPAESDSYSATQEIPSILWNPMFHHRLHNIPSTDCAVNSISPVTTLTFYFCKIQFNIILPSMLKSPKWSLPFRFSDQIVNAFLISHMSSTCSVLHILVDLVTAIIGEEYD
jgi:hypothetical protein